jgi:hypothetical protein
MEGDAAEFQAHPRERRHPGVCWLRQGTTSGSGNRVLCSSASRGGDGRGHGLRPSACSPRDGAGGSLHSKLMCRWLAGGRRVCLFGGCRRRGRWWARHGDGVVTVLGVCGLMEARAGLCRLCEDGGPEGSGESLPDRRRWLWPSLFFDFFMPQSKFSGESLDPVGSGNGCRSHIGFFLWGVVLLTLLSCIHASWGLEAHDIAVGRCRRAMRVIHVVACAVTTITTRKTLIHGPIIYGAPRLGAPRISIRGAPRNMRHMSCLMRGAPNMVCATDITPIRGAHRRAPQIKVICGLICVAHARCATKPKNGAPQIGVLLVVDGDE